MELKIGRKEKREEEEERKEGVAAAAEKAPDGPLALRARGPSGAFSAAAASYFCIFCFNFKYHRVNMDELGYFIYFYVVGAKVGEERE